jgi:uncharacterized membrane protein YdjX (TVP38/TMEM64 family)
MPDIKAPPNPTAAHLRQAGRVGLALLMIAGIVAAWHWRTGLDPTVLGARLARSPTAPLVFLALHIAASLFFVPRTLLAVAAGLAFGMWWGTLWAVLGSVVGACAGFLVARYVNAGVIDAAGWDAAGWDATGWDATGWARLSGLLGRVERGGWRAVAMIRLIPVIPHSLTNYALGLTRVGLVPFAVGSLLGQLPLTIAYADLGAAGGRVMLGAGGWIVPTAIGAAALSLSVVIPIMARRRPAPEA